MFHICLYYTVLPVPCTLVITCWEGAGTLALLCVMFPCVFVTFPYGVSGQAWYLIVSTADYFSYFLLKSPCWSLGLFSFCYCFYVCVVVCIPMSVLHIATGWSVICGIF